MAIIKDAVKLTDLISIETLQKIQDSFSTMSGIAAVTTDVYGIAITRPTNFSEFCVKYIRSTEVGRKRCEECDRAGAEMAHKAGRSCAYYCHAGLMDFAAPIIVDGHMIGCFIGGQLLTKPVNEEECRIVARETGVDAEKLLEAARKVRIMDKDTIDKSTTALYDIANVLSEVAYNKHQIYLKNLELMKSSSMKSDFLANMSHEIRTPMNAVIGMAEMALREEISPAARNYISQIKSSGQTLLTIINDILDFSKIESGQMDINEVDYEPMSLINDISNIIMTRIGNKPLELTLDIVPDLPHELHGDNIRIKQIMVNLANNAIKFTQEGNVHLKVDFRNTEENGIMLQIDISDTGRGIKKEDMPKLFKSFQQLDSKRNRNIEGTGLGLAICKQLISLMGGKIQVKSVYGEGSTFSFVLPQKVVNKSPSIEMLQKDIVTAGLIRNGYIEEEIEIDMPRFGAVYLSINSEEELSLLEGKDVSYLFVEQPLFTARVQDFLKEHKEITGVVLVNFRAARSYAIPNVRVIKKPLYTLSIASIFKGEDVYSDCSQMEADDFDFTAPEAEILVVDDNAINLTVVQGLLNPLDMNIETALSGKEAVTKIMEKRYDIIFMDHMMPEMDGVETTRVIRRMLGTNGQVPIIALTANVVDGTREMFISEGMDDFVTKPIEIRVIVSKLKQWLPKEKIIRKKNAEHRIKTKEKSNITITGLDVESAIRLLGNEKLFWAVLKDYYRVISRKYDMIKEYEENEQWKEYTIEVHTLKSSSRQIGAKELADTAERMEAAGNAGDAAAIHETTPGMLEQYMRYKEILEPYFIEEAKEQGGRQANNDEIAEFFNKMKTALDNLDMDDMEDTIKEMGKYSYSGKQQEYFEELKNAVEDMDTEKCEEILGEWGLIISC